MSDEQFDQIISEVMNELPSEYIDNLKNVAIVIADEPTQEQRQKQNLRCDQTLYGLYEGIPQTKRGAGYNMVLPDKITIFKNPILLASRDLGELKANTKRTLWHEIAHHYGLDHDDIHRLQND
ncbi:metallopeptidase family protein [Candidatus Saccharibacteria bacterium]|nr:metallopeptidase family protein [Candidatus Saccharibacteria bacterium]